MTKRRKILCIAIVLALVFVLYTLVGCSAIQPQESSNDSGSNSSVSTETGSGQTNQQTGSEIVGGSQSDVGSKTEKEPQKQEQRPEASAKPTVSPLAILDSVDVSAALGDTSAEGWSFAIKAASNLVASYGFLLTSEITDEEKLNLECGLGLGFNDLFGLRADNSSSLGFGLFGGGEASVFLNYRGPKKNSDLLSKKFDVGFRHDGDLIWYAGEDGNETSTSLAELKASLQDVAMTETFERMEEAFTTIPEELKKGASLRFAVEKLIDLGFTAEVDDTDGVAVTLKAGVGFYTDLLNDLFAAFIPEELLDYIPRIDFGYERTVFNIRLAFDGNGIFKEYSISSDVALTASLEIRHLFFTESTVSMSGDLSFTAGNN